MWDVYALKADAQAAADTMTANMKLPLGPKDVTRQWDVPKATADGKWAFTTPTDLALLKDVVRGTATAKPVWTEVAMGTSQATAPP